MSKKIKNNAAVLPSAIIKHIQHLERMRQDFVANVSHELRTPLTVLHGYLETLLDKNFSDREQCQKIFLQMQQQTTRMENLIEDLLLLSHLESQEDKTKKEKKIMVSELLTNICNEAKALSGKSQHHFTLQVDKNILLIGCKEELSSLFSNIIFNAVKYTPAGGNIAIEWYRKNKQAYFKVSDTGIGVAAKHIPRLTERFYRVDPARSRSSGGTGLGLAITKHVVMRHQAKLEISSKLGKGSIFACIFPSKRMVVCS